MKRLICLVSTLVLLAGSLAPAEDLPAVNEAAQKRIDNKSAKLLEAARIDDTEKAARVKAIMGQWLVTMWNWHAEHDGELKTLWSDWAKARSGDAKDEFPGEVIAHKIDDLYASLKPAYQGFIDKLKTELSEEQIDALKEQWSRSPGMRRTYGAYLEIAPDLNDKQKKVIADRMAQAREDAMLTDADKEIVSIYKRHKLKVEQFIGALEWAKLHKAFANKGKTPTSAPATAPAGND